MHQRSLTPSGLTAGVSIHADVRTTGTTVAAPLKNRLSPMAYAATTDDSETENINELTKLTPAANLHQQSLTLANIFPTISSRLFVTNRVTKQRNLVDNGSVLWVFLRKLLFGRTHELQTLCIQWDHHPHLRMDILPTIQIINAQHPEAAFIA